MEMLNQPDVIARRVSVETMSMDGRDHRGGTVSRR